MGVFSLRWYNEFPCHRRLEQPIRLWKREQDNQRLSPRYAILA